METVTVFIADGSLVALESGNTQFLRAIGEPQIRRASHVEPACLALRVAFHLLRSLCGDVGRIAEFTRKWVCLWRINMTPIGGPVLSALYVSRSEAIAAEINWFNEYGIQN